MLYQAKWTVSTYKIMTGTRTSPPERSTYRHGDLRRALLEAGTQLARAGGPDAVVLREATRRAGVVPNAAYGHSASRWELLQAVRSAALSALAVAMEAELAKLPHGNSPADFARASCERLAPLTCGLHRKKRDCSGPPSRSPMKHAALPFRLRPGIAASIPFNCWARRSTGSSKPACCRPTVAQVRNTWRGPRCAGWPCCSQKGRFAGSLPRKGMSSG